MTNLKLALKGNERIFDIGCEDGKVTAEIAKQLPNGSVLGVEFEMKVGHSDTSLCY